MFRQVQQQRCSTPTTTTLSLPRNDDKERGDIQLEVKVEEDEKAGYFQFHNGENFPPFKDRADWLTVDRYTPYVRSMDNA